MKNLIAVTLFLSCNVVFAQVKSSNIDADIIRMCGHDYKSNKVFTCYAERYAYFFKILTTLKSTVDTHLANPTVRPDIGSEAMTMLKNSLDGAKNFNAPFVIFLRAELKKSPAALALLPKLLAAVDVSLSGQEVESGESLLFYRARIARNHAAAVSLLKEVEFSRS